MISGSAYKGSKVDIYNKSGDWLATTIANEEGKLLYKTFLLVLIKKFMRSLLIMDTAVKIRQLV